MQWVPFTVASQSPPESEFRGMLYDEGDHLRFEYQMTEISQGMHKHQMKYLRVPVEEVVSVYLMKGWLKANWVGVKIVIQTAHRACVKEMPGLQHGRLELDVSKSNVPLAEAFVYGLYGNTVATSA